MRSEQSAHHLRFLYSGNADLHGENVVGVLRAADMFQVRPLVACQTWHACVFDIARRGSRVCMLQIEPLIAACGQTMLSVIDASKAIRFFLAIEAYACFHPQHWNHLSDTDHLSALLCLDSLPVQSEAEKRAQELEHGAQQAAAAVAEKSPSARPGLTGVVELNLGVAANSNEPECSERDTKRQRVESTTGSTAHALGG